MISDGISKHFHEHFHERCKKTFLSHSNNFSGTLTQPFETSYTPRYNLLKKISQLCYGWTDLSIL